MIKGIKICGISDPKTLNYLVSHNYPPQFIGFIVNYPRSKRYVDLKKLNELLKIDKKNSLYVVQYWDVDSAEETYKSLTHTLEPAPAWINEDAKWYVETKDTGIAVTHTMEVEEEHPLFPEYKVEVYKITNSFNWFTGKGQIYGDIWLKKKDESKGKNPKIEIFANGKCEQQKKKF